MSEHAEGTAYRAGETIVRQGEIGECMFVIQEGEVEVVRETDGDDVRLAVLGVGDFFGEMAILEQEVRSATVRALGEARALAVDKKTFHHRLRNDPTIALRILQGMSQRVRLLNDELVQLKKSTEA
jgi:CRP-like cAMP-binding protein